FGEVAANTVGKNGDFRVNVHARLEVRSPLAMASDAAIAGADTDDTLAVHQQVGPRKSREHVDAFGLGKARHPLTELLQRDDVMAVVAQRWRRDREFNLAGLCEEVDAVFGHL